MARVVNTSHLPGETARQFEGYHYADVPVSFFVSDTQPGRGASAHGVGVASPLLNRGSSSATGSLVAITPLLSCIQRHGELCNDAVDAHAPSSGAGR